VSQSDNRSHRGSAKSKERSEFVGLFFVKGGQIFKIRPPQKNLGGKGDREWGLQIRTLRVYIASREELSRSTPKHLRPF